MSEQQERAERLDGPSFEAKVRAIRILLSHWRQPDVPASVEGEPGSVLEHMEVHDALGGNAPAV